MKRLTSVRASCGSCEHLLSPRVVLLLLGGLRGVLLGTLRARQVERGPAGVMGVAVAVAVAAEANPGRVVVERRPAGVP